MKQVRSNKQQGKATQHTQGSHLYMYVVIMIKKKINVRVWKVSILPLYVIMCVCHALDNNVEITLNYLHKLSVWVILHQP